jgi:hypothetical protein
VLTDLQKLGSTISSDIDGCRKALSELDIKKAEKRDVIEVKGFIVNGLD